MFNDLREFLKKAEELGQVKLMAGADWDREIGRIGELQLGRPDAKLLLFDKIKGYKAGYRVLAGFYLGDELANLVQGLPAGATGKEREEIWREKLKGAESKPVPPVEVETGPVMENIHIGDEVDLFEFPTPKWQELDGGRYIGTHSLVIQRDPDEGWINLGTYRVEVHDKNTATIYIDPGKHGNIIRRKYWERGLSCPVAVVCGAEPGLWSIGPLHLPWGFSEYDYLGGLRQKPVEVVRGKTTGLPIPAAAEIVLEGEIVLPGTDDRLEAPFNEYPGYYSSRPRKESAFKVKAVYHRNDPILTGLGPRAYGANAKAGAARGFGGGGRTTWNELSKWIPGIRGVARVGEASTGMMVISLKQMYAGHAKSAGLLAAGLHTLVHTLRWVIVVDDDIDPNNIHEVLWALGQRCDPATSIEIIKGLASSELDPMLSPWDRSRNNLVQSRAIVVACKPYEWIDEFPPAVRSSPEALKETEQKWGRFLYAQD